MVHHAQNSFAEPLEHNRRTIELALQVATTVTGLSLTEGGEVKDGLGTAYRFTSGQAIAVP
jgi:hypothetical protein